MAVASAVAVLAAPGGKAGPFEFLWLSDIHWDPTADASLVKELASKPATQWKSILQPSQNGSARFSNYGEDTNWALLSSALGAAQKVGSNTAFLVVTGDMFPHHFREHFAQASGTDSDEAFRAFARKTFLFVTAQLQAMVPGRPVYLTLGNNDDLCGDYSIEPSGPFLADTAATVSTLLHGRSSKNAIEDWRHWGTYDIPDPALKKARLIALDTTILSARYQNECGAATGGKEPADLLLSWLDDELARAENKGEYVWILAHIPPGMDGFATWRARQQGDDQSTIVPMWKPSYQERFVQISQKHKGVVRLMLAGHTHSDDFRPFEEGLVLMTPAISPNIRQNPAFRVVSVREDGVLTDTSTYFLANLPQAIGGSSPDWKLEYRATQSWHVPDLSLDSLRKVYGELLTSPQLRQTWMNFYTVAHPGGSINNQTLWPQLCASGNLSPNQYGACLSEHTTSETGK
jgi:sphingomyelin phosphodiesterase acid-like 3